MRLLLTRPAADAARTAAALRARGHEPILVPLLDIEIMPDADLGAGPWQALLVTSANAVRAIAGHQRHGELRGVAVFTVGERSAQAMRDVGFANVTAAGGNVTDLARLVVAHMKSPARLLYLAGEERSGDLAGLLRARSFAVDTVLVYRAAIKGAAQATAAFAADVEGVLHFSRRSAEAYLAAARATGLFESALRNPIHYCLSARVAEPLRLAGAARLHIAARADERALLDLCV